MVEFRPLIIRILFKQLPEIIIHKQDHLGYENKCKEHNNPLNGSGMDLTVTEMTKSVHPRLICIINFFYGKLVL